MGQDISYMFQISIRREVVYNILIEFGVCMKLVRLIKMYSLTHSLTPWCRILFEKLIITQLVKKILLSYGT
jgi:hypothetical protein